MSKTNITKQHEEWLSALRDPSYDNFALFSCFLDGEPTCAIVAVNHGGDGTVTLAPLFVAVTKGMKLVDHESVPRGSLDEEVRT